MKILIIRNSHLFLLINIIVICTVLSGTCAISYSQISSYWPTEGWKTSTPEKQGINSQKLADGINRIIDKSVNLHSVLVIRNGYIVADAYKHPYTPDTKHDQASVTKSITSTLIGTAIQKGYIENVEQKVLDFYPDRIIRNNDENKKAITIKDLLTMKAGLEWDENEILRQVTFFEMINNQDWVQFMLDLPMVNEPGKHWVYNSGNMQLLTDIIHQASGKSALELAREELFLPLGISDVSWPYDNKDIDNMGSCCLRMTPQDLAKIGYLYLNDGIWDGKRILPAGWVTEATKRHTFLENSLLGTTGYGYLWWLQDGGFRAEGRGAQHLYVFPEMDLIVVTTGGTWENKAYEVLKDYILPAVQSDSLLPENNKSYHNLQAAIQRAAKGKFKSVKSSGESPLAKRISEKIIVLDSNQYALEYLSVTFKNGKEALFTVGYSFDCDKDCPPTYLVGLDGNSRISPGRFGIPAEASGYWKSGKKLVIIIDEIGNINRFKFILKFENDLITGQIEEMTGLGNVEITGKIEELK